MTRCSFDGFGNKPNAFVHPSHLFVDKSFAHDVTTPFPTPAASPNFTACFKSLSNRALLLGALSGNGSSVTNASDCDDTRVMQRALTLRPRWWM